MKGVKYIVTLSILGILLFVIPNISNAAVEVSRNVLSNNGSMKFNFTGLSLDTTHEYEYGFTMTQAGQVENWYTVTEYTASTASVNLNTNTSEMRAIFNAADTGYVTIRDKNTDTIVVNHYAVNFKLPYFNVASYTIIENGKEFDGGESGSINILTRGMRNCNPYYQYEKITDQNVINKYKEIKENNGDITQLESMLKTSAPNTGWISWFYWNSYDYIDGYGYPQKTIEVPDSGLYYMWIYLSGDGVKDIYGYILVDNLAEEVAVQEMSLPKTKTVEMGKTITLEVTFNPSTATNKIVTWTSSDESVATVDNAGKVTPKKVGSTVITATSQDGNKKATCTVTVTRATNNNQNNNTSNNNQNTNTGSNNQSANNSQRPNSNINVNTNNNNSSSNNSTSGSSNNKNNSSDKKDTTTATGRIPQTGFGITIGIVIACMIVVGVITYFKFRYLRGIK